MVLTVHHLKVSQSERVTWLLEELELPYELKLYTRNAADSLAPDAIKNLPNNPLQSAPVFHDSDGDVTLAESGAIVQYVLTKYGKGRLEIPPTAPNWPTYLEWFHRINGSILPAGMTGLILRYVGMDPTSPTASATQKGLMKRHDNMLAYSDAALAGQKWLAGDEFTAADIMLHFGYCGSRFFNPFSLEPYPNILRWTRDCAARPAFRRAFEKGDPELLAMLPLGPKPPTEDDKFWKK